MVEFDGAVEVTGLDGPVPFVDLFQGRGELVVYKHMWYDGAPHQGQCEGCTTTAWHVKDAVYLNARAVSFAVLTSGPGNEVAPYVEFMGYTQPWYSARGVEAPVNGSLGLLDMTPYGRREAWERTPRAGPRPLRLARRSVGTARRSAGTGARTRTASPLGAPPAGPCRSGPAPARPLAARATTADARGKNKGARCVRVIEFATIGGSDARRHRRHPDPAPHRRTRA